MSNEIKPVAWRYNDYLPVLAEGYAYGYTNDPESPVAHEPLYDQSAIDRLTAERDGVAAQLAEYKADAERWRICRDPKHPTDGESQPIIWLEGRGNLWVASEWLTGEFADRAADDAIYVARKGAE